MTAIAALLSACHPNIQEGSGVGGLQVSLANISASVTETKATPSQLTDPVAEDFRMDIVRLRDNGSNVQVYSGAFTEQVIRTVPGEFEISVEAGNNERIAYDSPYYFGKATARVSANAMAPTKVEINCKVANSLVSVRFGGNAEERARFSKFYSSAALVVDLGDISAEIDMANQDKSIYLQEGSSFVLNFRGNLNADPETTLLRRLESQAIPDHLEAGEHLVVTLNVEHSADGVTVNISKAELVEDERNSSIFFEWLPVPQLTSTHRYDQDGTLVGTKVETNSSFPGCKWTAEIINSNNVTVRTLSGQDSLSSDYDESQDWPYIPAGEYSVNFTYTYKGKIYKFPRTGTLSVPSPEAIGMTLEGGYTSYDLYTQGDINGANACDKGTIYAPTAKVAIAQNILTGSNYSNLPVSYIAKVDDNQLGSAKNVHTNTQKMDNAVNLTSRTGVYEYSVEAIFDGCSSSQSENHYITGLPVTYNPPGNNSGWSWVNKRDGEWNDDHVKLATGATPASEARTPNYHLPNDVNVKVTSDLDQYGSFLGIKCGYEVKFVKKNTSEKFTTDNPRAFYYHDGTLSGTDYITIKNTYVAAGYYLRVYSVKIEYR